MPPTIIGAIPDTRADQIVARCLAARPRLTLNAMEADLFYILLTEDCDDPDYFLCLLNAARRAQTEAARCS